MTVSGMKTFRSVFARPAAYDHADGWVKLVKKTVARFARGNIAAQEERILTVEEQDDERPKAHRIARQWKTRYKAAKR